MQSICRQWSTCTLLQIINIPGFLFAVFSGFGDSVISRSDIYRLDFTSVGQSQMLIDILREIDIER